MTLDSEALKEIARFPEVLRAVIDSELASGNSITEIGHSHPAPPVGAYVKFARKVSTRARASGDGLDFRERNSSLSSGEFTDDARVFFIVEPPDPPPPEPDMDAIRRSLTPAPDEFIAPVSASARQIAQRHVTDDHGQAQVTVLADGPTGWTRIMHFRDRRPPHEVRFEFERLLMVLCTVTLDEAGLRAEATAHVNGARYDLALRYLAIHDGVNYFSLRVVASWPVPDAQNAIYFRNSSVGWFNFWTRDLSPAVPPSDTADRGADYLRIADASMRAESHLDSVAAVQQAIVEGVRGGCCYVSSHKEGGSTVSWRDGRFIRSDYGDSPDLIVYADQAALLKALWLWHQFDVTSHAGGRAVSELDAWKLILRRMLPG